MKLGISSWAFPWSIRQPGKEVMGEQQMSAFDLLDWAHDAGVPVVQFADNLTLPNLSTLAERAEEFDIEIELGMRGVEPNDLLSTFHAAEVLNCRLIRTLLPASFDEERDFTIDRLYRVLPRFERAGVVLALENYEAQSSKSLLELVNHFDSDSLKVCLDTANSIGRLEKPAETVDVLAPATACLHIKDFGVERVPEKLGFQVTGRQAGTGMLNVPWIVRRVRSENPDVSVILEQWPPFTDSVQATVDMERAWAREGIAYLQRILASET